MQRCYCPCHSYPGTYPPPCGYCGHDTRLGRMIGGVYDGWVAHSCDDSSEEAEMLTVQGRKPAKDGENRQ